MGPAFNAIKREVELEREMEQELHWMIDIETLGTKPGCTILSIGLVGFDRHGVKGEGVQRIISRASCADVGLIEDPITRAWWESQPSELKEPRLRPAKGTATALPMALYELFCRVAYTDRVWCHGAPFDVPILEAAFIKCGMRSMIQWDFRLVRDTRTIYELAGEGPDKTQGVVHDELADAIRQAEAVIRSWAKLTPTPAA